MYVNFSSAMKALKALPLIAAKIEVNKSILEAKSTYLEDAKAAQLEGEAGLEGTIHALKEEVAHFEGEAFDLGEQHAWKLEISRSWNRPAYQAAKVMGELGSSNRI